jgi:hypothetical protein
VAGACNTQIGCEHKRKVGSKPLNQGALGLNNYTNRLFLKSFD